MRYRLALPLTVRRGQGALALLCAAQFVMALDVQIVAIALPAIRHDLDLNPTTLQWVVSAYVLAFGGLLLPSGRAADLFGRRKLFIFGFALFTVASLLCGLATSGFGLVAARVLQGIGAALVCPAALSLLTTTFAEGSQRTRALGVWGAAAPLGGASGFIFGGLLTGTIGWPWVFWVNLPVGLLALALAPLLLQESRGGGGGKLDLPGVLLGTSGLVVVMYVLTRLGEANTRLICTVGLTGLAAALLVAFWLRQRHAPDPLLPPALLQHGTVARANLTYLILTAVNSPALFLLTLYLQDVKDYTPLEAGLAFLPASLLLVAAAPLGSWLVTCFGSTLVASGGTLTLATALLLFSRLTTKLDYASGLLPGLVLLGMGLGVASVAATVAGTSGRGGDEQGTAAALLNVSAQVGTALGLAAFVALSTGRADAMRHAGLMLDAAFMGGFCLALTAAAALSGTIGLFLALCRPSAADHTAD